jgi:ketosteroid isomerase-like protein
MGCAAEPSPERARTAIAGSWREFRTAMLAGDAPAATAAFFSEDAISLGQGAPDCHGRAEITKTLAEFLETSRIVSVEQITEELEIEGDLAFERGSVTQTFQQDGGDAHTERTRYLAIWRRQPDDTWKCHRLAKH